MAAPIFLCLQFLCLAFFTIVIQTRADYNDTLGTWDVIVQNAGIAAMHAAVTRYNTVVLLDRTDTGASNISLPNGQCRNDTNDITLQYDCSAHSVLLDLSNNSIRPLTIQTDTWCSSGQFLPNGTLLQSGGWNDGAQTFRMFTPCDESDYSTDDCDWYELPNTTASLYNARWYASNQILPNGSIIIVGGIGTYSMELYPQTGFGPVDFPFLAQMNDDENDNLYPYVHLLPNGYLFIFANNRSVLYDHFANEIVSYLPDLEGGPRNYPSAGSSVMLALEGDYSNATIVICGGAQYNAFQDQNVSAPAQGSCGRIVATDQDPVWAMEDMPLVRIMGEMLTLPTGDVLIINGAQAGSQGFGLATDPCLYPVLYQPDLTLGSRFTILNNSTIPRWYHSTANLLPDARILIAGSNTHWAYTWTWDPTELRIEAFSPGYLAANMSNLRLVVEEAPQTVQYGNAYNVSVTVPSSGWMNGTMEVNFASAPFSTHSFSQGQRLVKLAIIGAPVEEDNGQYNIAFNTPPNAMVAPPGYYMMFVVNLGVPSIASWVQLIAS